MGSTYSPLCRNYINSKWISNDFVEFSAERTEEYKKLEPAYIVDTIAQIELVQQFQNSLSKSKSSLSLNANEQNLLIKALRGYSLEIHHSVNLTSLNGSIQDFHYLLPGRLSNVVKRMSLHYNDSEMRENLHNLVFWKGEYRRARRLISYMAKTLQSSRKTLPSYIEDVKSYSAVV